jgi:hypothetical protein
VVRIYLLLMFNLIACLHCLQWKAWKYQRVIRSHTPMKGRQYNDKKEKDKLSNNDRQNTTKITNQRESHWMSRVSARVPDGLSVSVPLVWLVKLPLNDTNINVLETSLRKIQIRYIKHKFLQHKNERRQTEKRKWWRTSRDRIENVRTCKWANWTTCTPLNAVD